MILPTLELSLTVIIATLFSCVLAWGVTMLFNRFRHEITIKHYVTKDSDRNLTWKEKFLEWSESKLTFNKEEINQKMQAAGFYNSVIATYYMPIKLSLFAIATVIVLFTGDSLGLEETRMKIVAIASITLVVVFGPEILLDIRKKALAYAISQRLPYLLDLMAVCVQSGMSIEASIHYLATEMASFDRDIAHLLKKTNDRAKVVGLEKALNELLTRVPTNEMRSFVNTLNQSLQYGTSIYQVLSTLAKDIRDIQILALEEKVGKLSAKMSVPLILFIMMPIVILITAPGIMRMMANGIL
ncbi:type II secretion system F family protein [Parasalinivibrio latis]|uniref:type II secretion system F family protein n=1 Tax=Parasalinivibrio latis TaxID=2952610 RepID=UPI0030E3B876